MEENFRKAMARVFTDANLFVYVVELHIRSVDYDGKVFGENHKILVVYGGGMYAGYTSFEISIDICLSLVKYDKGAYYELLL